MPKSRSGGLTSALILSALAACGSGASDTVNPPPPPPPPSPAALERDAFAIPNTATATSPTDAQFSTGSITTLGGTRADPEAVTFRIAGRTYVFDEAAGDTVSPAGDFVFYRDNGAPTRTEGFIDTRGTFVTYGRVRQGPTSAAGTDGFLGLVADGPATVNVPTSGSASFSGKAIGYAVLSGSTVNQIRTTNADVDVAVNFGSGSVDLRTSSTVAFNGTTTLPAPTLNVSGSGTLDGAGYSGALASSSSASLQGEFRGEFFGGAAEETGGVIAFEDAGTTYGAAFGASRTPGQID